MYFNIRVLAIKLVGARQHSGEVPATAHKNAQYKVAAKRF